MEHVAIDLGGRESQVCIRAADGTVLLERKVATSSLASLLERRPHSRVVVETCAVAFHVADAALAHAPTSSQHYETTNPAKASLAMAKAASGSARTDAVRAGMGKLRRTLEEIVVKYMFKGTVTRWDDQIKIAKITTVAWSQQLADEINSTFEELSRFVEGHSHRDDNSMPPEPEDLKAMIQRVEGIVARARMKRKGR